MYTTLDIPPKDQSWANIFLYPYPLGTITRFDMLSSDTLMKLLELNQKPNKILDQSNNEFGSGNLPFNSSQLGWGSVILRQITQPSLAFNSLTAELFVKWKSQVPYTNKLLATSS